MYRLTMAEGSSKRRARDYGLAALVLAALTLLSVMPAPTRAQGQGQGKVSMNDFHFVMLRNHLGIVRGQTLRVTMFNNLQLQDGSVRTVKAGVKVFDGSGNLLCQTDEVEIPFGQFHSFDIRPGDAPGQGQSDINDIYVFRGTEGRNQIGFEASFRGGVFVAAGDINGVLSDRLQAGFELVDDESGKSILIGQLLPAIQKVR